jgi:hypothetical protein
VLPFEQFPSTALAAIMMIKNRHGLFVKGCCVALLFMSHAAPAEERMSGAPAFELRGFGSLGVARSTNGQAEVARDLLQRHGISSHWSGKFDSIVGLQVNHQASETVEMVAQAISRYNYKGNFAPEVTELLVKYEPNAYLNLRVGRLGTDFSMHGDARAVGYSRLTVRPNIDFFSTLPVSYFNGVDGQVTFPLGGGLAKGKLYYGFLAEKLPFPGDYLDLRGSRSVGGYIDYSKGDWEWRGGMAWIGFKHQMPGMGELQTALRKAGALAGIPDAARAARALDLRGTNAKYYSAGLVYDRNPVLLQLFLGRLDIESEAIRDQDTASFLASYRLGEVSPFIGYSRVKSRRSHLVSGLPNAEIGAEINKALAAGLRESYSDHYTLSLGLRWDFQRNMALKFQVDAIRGHADSVFIVREETPRWNGKTNVFTLALHFVF